MHTPHFVTFDALTRYACPCFAKRTLSQSAFYSCLNVNHVFASRLWKKIGTVRCVGLIRLFFNARLYFFLISQTRIQKWNKTLHKHPLLWQTAGAFLSP